MAIFQNVIHEVWGLANEMAPYLLLGFLLAGVMHEFVPRRWYHTYLSGRSMKSVLWAALFGVPLPLCSCGVIPTAMGLRREGAGKGATISFLIATPQTGVDSIVATYSLMGLPFAIIRPLAAMVTAVMGGWLVNVSDDEVLAVRAATKHEGECSCGCSDPHHDAEGASSHDGCGSRPKTFLQRVKSILSYAFVEMMEDIGKWLVVGLVVAGMITALVPDEWFAVFQDNSLLSILLVLVFSIPMYLCATGSIPIAVALMMKGLTPGAALVLLMAGPASNAASIMVIDRVLGRRTLLVYLASIVAGAVLFALGIDLFLPARWFACGGCMEEACCETGHGWVSTACTVLLVLVLLHAFSPIKLWGGAGCHCACHHHGHEEGCCCNDEHEEVCCCHEREEANHHRH